MIKKNTYSFYHKRIRTALCAVLCSVLTAMPAFATGEDNSPTAAASTTVWTKASEIMQDVYSQIISISLLCVRRQIATFLESIREICAYMYLSLGIRILIMAVCILMILCAFFTNIRIVFGVGAPLRYFDVCCRKFVL